MSSDFGIQHLVMPFEGNQPGPSHMGIESPSATPPAADATDLLRLLTDGNGYGSSDSPKAHLERLLSGAMDVSHEQFPLGIDIGTFGMAMDIPMQYGDMGGMVALRNSSKTLKCPKCNWHYKYQETLEIHMKEKHSDGDVRCVFCVENRVHPKLARGESYSCGYKPYRCELCKYSTTTKGNLSIHMQSDKHLHAMQELPTSIASLACPPSSARSPVQDGDKTFVCVVCGCFSSDSLQEMMQHADKDRSRPTHGDISMNNGVFRCHLCPYNTNLKANFQLHTRTDKHLQRVQMVNHIREGSTTSSALCRLGNAKSVFQVLCRPCQEILPSASSLREHFESVSHRTNLRQPITHYQCSVCTFETPHKSEAIAHMTCHEPSTWPQNTVDFDVITMEEDAAYACASCGFATREATTLEEHARSHEEGEQCPLCTDRTLKLTEHLIQEHKIAESAVERLLSVHPPESASSSANNFSFRCPQCAMAFRNESSLQSHSILHLFSTSQKCPTCSTMCSTNEELKSHIETEHPKEEESRCELCQEAFSSKTALVAHFNSVRHLHKAKKQLEQQGSVDLSAQVLAVLNPSSPSDKKPFRCNICKIGYGQGATLDIHLRSVAHQSRMSKIADLVANGDIDASKPVLEQPGGPAQRIIRDLMDRDDEPVSAQQQNVMTMFNIMNMLMGQNQGMPMSFSTAKTISGEGTPDNEDDISSPKNAIAFAAMLKAFGNEKVIFLAPGLSDKISRISEIADEKIETISRVNCTECGEDQSSILALSFHVEELHSGVIPENTLRSFAERLLFAICELDDTPQGPSSNGHESPTTSRTASRDDSEPPEKRPRSETSPLDAPKPDLAQMAMLSMMGGFPFMPPNPLGGFMPSMGDFFNPMMAQHMQLASSPAKRARTRITDEQLKILRQYFDINNSPSENQIKEMSLKAGLPEKVIKHWFRNTLFKERQRDKDSPYNFNVPPQMGIDLDTYEKTGETKVVPLATDVKRDQPDEIESKPTEPSSSVPPLNLQAMMQQMQQANPFQFMDPAGMMGGSLSQLPQSGASSGRRANRTRFTDYQLRTLQQFFDKQAYPKDDDLEILSKKLQLSPRVIVVWFQNARQKARKIYENQPNHESNDRFVRTPGCNFQCKRCNLVFQRYYELIQHQQKKCYKDDGLAQANDNKGVEESLTEDEKAQLAQQATLATIAETKPADLLKLLGTSKSSTEALLKMCESAGASSSPSSSSGGFHKRCPFCGLLFRNKLSLTEHIPSRHPQQHAITLVDVDLLPNAEDVPVLIPPAILENREIAGVLDLSNSTQDRESLSMSPFLGQSDGDDGTEYIDDVSFPSFIGGPSTPHQAGGGRSPANNKRYRTHLTPTQVHVMKCVFADYKTPSMTECEFLGREIGLHKRVVQVWFQNARAKERKTRTSNGDDDLIRSSVTNCTACGVEYSGRITMQDHLFTSQHLARLKGQLRSDDTHAEPTSYPVENGNDIKTIARTAIKSKGLCPSQLNITNLNGFPFNFINGMLPGTLPLMYDTAMFGTPVPMLQIPESVKSQIKSDITAGSASSRFTQDGETVEDLRAKLSGDDARCLSAKEIEVGWACPSCTNVFQQEPLLKNHQRTVCQGTDTVLTLVQIHYECSTCSIRLGTQKEFCAHCESAEHQLVIRSTSSSAQ